MNIYLKSLLYLAIFSILHFGYDLTHWDFLTPFCGINESVFQHLKIAFWSYLLASLIEYFSVRRRPNKRESFWYPRIFSSTVIPWLIILLWYLVPAVHGRIKNQILDVSWSVVTTYLSGIIAGIIEKNIEEYRLTKSFKILIPVLVIISAFLYVWFTYNPPWIDLFVELEALST